ncbi:MAG TPA: hypothetical protein VKZ60_02665 [Chloroflexota bacterium]|jgi:hypothetical protein|nr:hypothetical protein [Chloroflexota bacterium]
MPRVSRSVAQRYANTARNKKKARGERPARILPPVTPQAPVEVPAGFGAPQPLDLPPPAPAASGRRELRGAPRAELRHAVRRAGAVPIVDYSYVRGDLQRIAVVFSAIVLALVALHFVPALQ